jgi:hypothetical protein
MKLEFSRQIFEKKNSDTKFHENFFSVSRVVSCGRTDTTDLSKLIVASHNLSKTRKNDLIMKFLTRNIITQIHIKKKQDMKSLPFSLQINNTIFLNMPYVLYQAQRGCAGKSRWGSKLQYLLFRFSEDATWHECTKQVLTSEFCTL